MEIHRNPAVPDAPTPSVPEGVGAALASPLEVETLNDQQRHIRRHFVASVGMEAWGDEGRTPWDALNTHEIEEVFRHLMRVYQEMGPMLSVETAWHAIDGGPSTDVWIALLYAGIARSQIFQRYHLGNGAGISRHYEAKREKLGKWVGQLYRLWMGWGEPYVAARVPLVELDELES